MGDLNSDGCVDLGDLGVLGDQWLVSTCVSSDCEADLDDSNSVNATDFALMAANWNARETTVVISEFMASNGSVAPLEGGELLDEDGESSDWIELYNTSTSTADIGGWYLTDSPNDTAKWRIPDGIELGPGKYTVIFASQKDRAVAREAHPG